MKAYILSIVGAVLLSAVVSMIVPDGKMGKLIRGVGKLIVVLFLIVPVINVFTGETPILPYADLNLDESYLETSAALAGERDEARISGYLFETYSVSADVTVLRLNDGSYRLKKILITITDFGIIEEGEHIDIMTQIKSALRSKYDCEVEVTA